MKALRSNGKSLAEATAEEIKQYILSNNLQPGTKIPSESVLCEQLGVSRPTVREALKNLAAESFVITKHGLGSFIPDLPGVVKDPLGVVFMDQKRLLFNAFETRLIMEPEVAALAAVRASEKEIWALQACLERSKNIISEGNWTTKKDGEFHQLIFDCAHNELLQRFMPVVFDSIKHGYEETLNVPGSQTRAYQAHKRIFLAIRSRDADLAKRECACHIKEAALDAKIEL